MSCRRYMLLAFVAGALAGPINVEDGNLKCAMTCTESLSDNAKFQYAVGSTYEFAYTGSVITKLEGSSTDSSALKITATADIEVLSRCEFALKLREVSLLENSEISQGSADFRRRLESNRVRFSFQDGRVESICPSVGEDDRVLNIKKGILSAFQNSLSSMDNSATVQEVDVTGSCSVEYKVEKSLLGGYTIIKSKDLLSCGERNGNVSSLQSEAYRVPSATQSLPLMRGTYNCEQTISGGVLSHAICKEEHVFRPFSKQNSGATTLVDLSLKLKRTRQGVSTRMEPVERRTSLLFQHNYDSGVDSNARNNVLAILTDICEQVKEDVRPETPELFSKLVYAMRKLTADGMADIKNSVVSGRLCATSRVSKFYMDAVPLVGTAASVAFMRDLIKDNTIQGAEADTWLTQLAFIQQPSIQMLTEVKPLLEDARIRSKAALGVSSLVHKVCSTVNNCERHPDVVAIVRTLEEMLGSNCEVNSAEDRERVMYALKAIGNAGRAISSSSILGACARNLNLDADIRVAALQAFRRLPCAVDHEAAMNLFQNGEEDSEVRINAYLAVMSCPSTACLLKVKMTLSGESVNQVGSFVWTHLTNLQETASVFKQDLRNILQDAKLREDYDCDARKYSHNYEKSFFSEYLNVGAQVESNVIFSQKSYIPRSAMLNLTVDMFGNSVNLLEVGGRVQGMETILEKFFGKNGYFSQTNMKSMMRNKRDINHSIASIFDKIFKIRDDKMKGGLYMKALGNELFYKDLTSETFAQSGINFLDIMMKLAEPADIDLTHSTMFLDASLIIPTAIGMPLNLTVNGTATLNLQVGGKMDVRKLGAAPRSLDISGHIKPSAAIVVSGIMSVDGLGAQSTLKMVATLHTSTMLEGNVKLQDGEVLSAELKAPRDKMEVVSVESKFLMNGREMKMPIEGRTQVRQCSGEMLTKMAGVEVCAEATIPPFLREGAAHFPFTGPVSAKVILKKKDSMDMYSFEARYQAPRIRENGVDYVKRVARLSFDTPGSAIDRKMLVELNLDQQKMAAEASFITPWKKMSADASLVNGDDLKRANIRVTLDGQSYYSSLAEVSVDTKNKKSIFSPRIELNIPGYDTMVASGTIETSAKQPAFIDVTFDKFTSQPIKLSGSLTKDKSGESMSADLAVASQWTTGKVEGSLDMKKDFGSVKLAMEYSRQSGQANQRVSLAGKYQDRSSGALVSYLGNIGLTATEFPWLAFSVEADHQMSMDHMESQLKLTHGRERKTLLVKHAMSKSGDAREAYQANLRTAVSYAQAVAVVAEIKHSHNSKEISTTAELTYGPSKTIKLGLNASNRLSGNGQIKASVGFEYPGQEARLSTELSKISDTEYTHGVVVQWGKSQSIEMNNSYRNSPASGYEISGSVRAAQWPIEYSGQLRLDPADFIAKLETRIQQNLYSAETTYSYELTKMARAFAQLSLPERTMNVKADVNLQDTHATSTVDVKWDVGRDESKQVAISAEYNAIDSELHLARDSMLTVKLPSITVQVSGTVKKADNNGVASLEFSYGDEKSKLSGTYDFTSDATGRVILNSPYIQPHGVDNLEVMFSHSGNLKKSNSHVELSWAPSKKIAVDIELDTSVLSTSLDVTTPFAPIARFGSSVSFNKDLSNFAAAGRAYLNSNEVSANAELSNLESGLVTISIPERTVRASFRHSYDGSKLKNKVEVSWSTDGKIDIDVNVGMNPDVGTVTIKTPFASARNIVLSVDHQGKSLTKFVTAASLSWNDKQIKGNVKYNGADANINLITPWRSVSASYKYALDNNGLAADGQITWSPRDTVAWRIDFDRSDAVTGKASFTSPFVYVQSIQAQFSHSGNLRSFESTGELSWEPTRKIVVSGKFASDPSIDGTFSLTTPFTVLSSTNVAFKHSGNLKAFRNAVTLQFATQEPIQFSSEYSQNGAKFAASSIPSEVLKTIEASYTYGSTKRKSSASAMAIWNGSQKIAATVETTTTKAAYEGNFVVTTPFSFLPQVSGALSHSGDLAIFNNHVELVWASTNKASVDTEFNRKALSGKVDARSPFGNALLSHSGDIKQCTTSVSVTSPENRVIATAKTELTTVSDLIATVTISTPFENLQSLSASVSHRGSWSDFVNHAEVSWAVGQSATFDSSFRKAAEIQGEVSYTCPSSQAAVSFKHEGGITDFRNTAEISWNNRQNAKFTSQFTSGDEVSGKATFTSTLKNLDNIRASFRHSGPLRSFENQAEFSWASGKVAAVSSKFDLTSSGLWSEVTYALPGASGSASYKLQGGLNAFVSDAKLSWGVSGEKRMLMETRFNNSASEVFGSSSFTSPFMNLENIAVSFRHTGDYQQFSNHVEASWASGKNVIADTTFSQLSGIIGSIKMTSSFENLRDVGATFNHSGSMRSFISDAEVSWSSMQKASSRIEFSMQPTVSGSWTVTSPVLNAVARVNHNGDSRGFTNSAEVSWADNKKISIASQFAIANLVDVEASASFTSPFSKLEDLRASVKQIGNVQRSFTNHAEVSWNVKDKMRLETSLDRSTGIRATVDFSSPFQNVKAAVSHTGSIRSFNSDAELTWGGIKKVAATVEFSQSPAITGRATFTSPFEYLRNVESSFNYKGNSNGFETDIDVSLSPAQKLTSNIALSIKPDISFVFALTSPSLNINASAKHSGDTRSFRNSAQLSWASDKKISAGSRFSSVPEIDASAFITSPFTKFEDLKASVKHSGDLLTSFTNHAEVSWTTNDKMSLDTSLDRSTGIRATVDFASPFQNVKAAVSHTGSNRSFNSDAELTWGGDKKVAATVEFGQNSAITGRAAFTSPFEYLRNVESSFNYKGNSNGFETDIDVSLSPAQKLTSNVVLSIKPDISFVFALTSPSVNINASAKHSGNTRSFRNSADLSWASDKKISVGSRFSSVPDIDASAFITSPFAKFEDLKASVKHSGDLLTSFTNHAEVSWTTKDKMSLDTSLDRSTGIRATVDIASPFQNVKAAVNHSGSIRSFNSKAELTWDSNKKVIAAIEFSQSSAITGKATFTSPFEYLRNFESSFSYKGNSNGFETDVDVSLSPAQRLTSNVVLSIQPDISFVFALTSPSVNINASANHSGDTRSFRNSADLSWASDKKISVGSRFSSVPDIDASAFITSPFAKFEDLKASVKHSGDLLTSFTNHAEVSWTTNDKMSLDTSLDRSNGIRATVDFVSPFQNVKAAVNHSGSIRSFSSNAQLTWDSNKKVIAAIEFSQSSATAGKATFTSPFEYLRSLEMSFNHSADRSGFETSADVTFSPALKMSSTIAFKSSPDISLTFALTTPAIAVNVNHSGALRAFRNKAELSWASGKKITLTSQLSAASGIDANVAFTSPFENFKALSATMTHSGDLQTSFTNHAEVSWNASDKMSLDSMLDRSSGVRASISLASPFQNVRVGVDHSGSFESFNTNAELNWGSNKKVQATVEFSRVGSSITGKAALNSPFKNLEALSVDLSHNGDIQSGFNSRIAVGLSASKTIAADMLFSRSSGYKLMSTVTTPFMLKKLGAVVEQRGYWPSAENTVELTWNTETIKLVSVLRMDESSRGFTASQVATTPFKNLERLSWSSNYAVLSDELTAHLDVANNEIKYEADIVGSYKDILQGGVTIKTPFSSFRENGVSMTLKSTDRVFSLATTAYYGSSSTASTINVHVENTGATASSQSVTARVELKTPLFEKEQFVDVSYSRTGASLSAQANVGIVNNKASVVLQASDAMRKGQVDTSYDWQGKQDTRRFVWNYEKNGSQLRTSFRAAAEQDPSATLDWSSNVAWSSGGYTIDASLSTPFETVSNGKMSLTLTGNAQQFVAIGSASLRPESAINFNVSFDARESIDLSAEVKTSFAVLQSASATVRIQRTVLPWTINIATSYNGKVTTLGGEVKGNTLENLDMTLTFASAALGIQDVQLTINNKEVENTWTPYASVSWAGSKRVDVSGSFSMARDGCSASIDISTPFTTISTLHAEVSHVNRLPSMLTSRFEIKTNTMSEKLAATLAINRSAGSAQLQINSPWQPIRSLLLSGSVSAPSTGSFSLEINNARLFSVSGNMQFASFMTHNGEITFECPTWSKFLRVKLACDLENSTHKTSSVELEYSKGKVVQLMYKHKQQPGVVQLSLTTPMSTANFEYTLKYTGDAWNNWTEHTEFNCTSFQFVSDTKFQLQGGFLLQHTCNLAYGGRTHTSNKTITFSGNAKKFDASVSCHSSYLPRVDAAVSWNSNPVLATVTVNDYSYQLSAAGPLRNLQVTAKAEFPYRSQKEAVTVTVSLRSASDVNGQLTIATPFEQLRTLQMTVNGNQFSGSGSIQYTGIQLHAYEASFSRSAASFETSGKFQVEGAIPLSWNGKLVTGDAFEVKWISSVMLPSGLALNVNLSATPAQGTLTVKNENNTGFSVSVSSSRNADGEYVPTIQLTTYASNGTSNTYNIQGLYKNVGQGVVRDFKLHLLAPQGFSQSVDFKVEFSIKSTQLVPGDAMIHLHLTDASGVVNKVVHLTADWSNDRILVSVQDPRPMSYEMTFRVSTKQQSVAMTLNWDTTQPDSNIRIDLLRKGKYNSQVLQETDELRVVSKGITYMARSVLEVQKAIASHNLKLEVADSVFGYELKAARTGSKLYTSSLKVITPLRSVLLEGSSELEMTSKSVQSIYVSWDVDRDIQKKVGGQNAIYWENNSIRMITSLQHPALSQDVRIVDEIQYNTGNTIASFSKTVEYSSDESKKLTLAARLSNDGASFALKHPSNNIDIDLSGNVRVSKDVYRASGNIRYLSVDGAFKTYGIVSSLDSPQMIASLQMESPTKTITTSAQLKDRSTSENNYYNVILNCNSDNALPVTTTIDVNGKDMTVNMKVNYDSSNSDNHLTLFAGRYNATSYSVELSHRENGNLHIDGLAAASLSDSTLLNGRLYWSPDNYIATKSKIEKIRQYVKESLKAFSDSVASECSDRLAPRFPELTSVADYSRRELALMQRDADVVSRRASDLYERDSFYIRSAADSASSRLNGLRNQVAYLKEKCNEMAAAVRQMYEKEVMPIMNTINSNANAYWLQVEALLVEIDTVLSEMANSVEARILEQSSLISQKASRVASLVREYWDNVMEIVANHPTMDTLKSVHSRTINAFNSYSDAAINRIEKLASAVQSRIVIQPEQASQMLSDAYDLLNSKLSGRLQSVMSRHNVYDLLASIMQKAKFLYEQYDIEHHVAQVTLHSKVVASEYLSSLLTSNYDSVLNDCKWITYDPQSGKFEFDLRIPSSVSGLDFSDIRSKLQNRLDQATSYVRRYSIPLKIRMYKPTMSDLLPPFEAYATISGQHILTFDRRHYDFFGGSCSYLLARDFENGDFSLIVNYDGSRTLSLAAVNGDKTIELMADNSVKVDGGKVELPLQIVNTTVTSEGSRVKLVNTLGLTVICDQSQGFCTVQMSGWYFSKTAGLLGTYNNEGSDDFTTSDNRNVSDVLEFANSWKLSSSCRSVNTAIAAVSKPSACVNMFEDASSPYSSCFSVIDSSMYTHMCTEAARLNVQEPHCTAARLYRDVCQREGVYLDTPNECLSCELPNKVIGAGESSHVTNVASSADIIFVVEERRCNEDAANKLMYLVNEMEDAFYKKGMKANRYGLVGFGGEGVHQTSQTHTIDGQSMNSAEKFRLGAESLQFSAGADSQDVFTAVKRAASYQFRAGSAKMIVLLTCSDCSKSEMSYSDIHAFLQSMDISLHVMLEHNFELIGQDKKAQTSALFGVDHMAVYTMRDAKGLKGDRSLNNLIRLPKNQCVSLALQSKGSLFDLRMLTKEKPNVSKSFMRVFAQRAVSTADAGDCQICKCAVDAIMDTKTVCSTC